MHIAKLSLKTNYPTPGTDEWLTLRSRALESLAHDAELRAWARDLGVTVKPSAVDAAVKQTLAGAFPGKTAGSIDQVKLQTEFKATGMTRALLRQRTETKLLAQAAARKIQGLAQGHGRAGQGAVREGQGHALCPAGASRGASHPRQDQGAGRSDLRRSVLVRCEVRGAREAVLDGHHHEGEGRRSRRRQPHRPRQGVRGRRVHDRPGCRRAAGQDPVRLAHHPGHGARHSPEHASARTRRSRSRSAASSSRRRARSTSRRSSPGRRSSSAGTSSSRPATRLRSRPSSDRRRRGAPCTDRRTWSGRAGAGACGRARGAARGGHCRSARPARGARPRPRRRSASASTAARPPRARRTPAPTRWPAATRRRPRCPRGRCSRARRPRPPPAPCSS